MRRALILAALLAWPAFAQSPCTTHSCSNDIRGVLGDETLSWDAAIPAPNGFVTSYDVCTAGEEACITTGGLSLLVSGTSLDAVGYAGGLKVRACDCHNPNFPCACGGWSNLVEIIPFACFDQQPAIPDGRCFDCTRNPSCERHCYPSSSYRSSITPPCP